MSSKILPGEDHHIFPMLGNLREQDMLEVFRADGVYADIALQTAWYSADKRWTIFVDDKPVAVAGVVVSSRLPNAAIPWLLATDEAEKVPLTFQRRAAEVLKEMLELRPRLVNYVDCGNAVSIKWLKWLGFTMLPAVEYGPFKAKFYPFYMDTLCATQAQ